MNSNDLLRKLQIELARLSAEDARVEMDDHFEPAAGTLVKLDLGDAYWHFLPGGLLELLEAIPDSAGSEAIQEAIETAAIELWHGPAPIAIPYRAQDGPPMRLPNIAVTINMMM